KKYIGKTIEVLIDFTKSENYFGKTRTGKNVRINSKRKNLVGKIIKVKITKANIWNLEGILP
ncbi:MAG TPA: tRNA (N6-isopentenyl adenosine(37)-C2)-methylthiotransferase MiaB, partial [Candidatus Moranbacteria bacterium]|nr:tRNA (N6-isopentenyl adenosine(37)-C2)-methylthiotransferase MiaB [Candidatus Moranbacteria bacterium]